MTMEQVVCHPWLLGDVARAPDDEEAAAGPCHAGSDGSANEQFFSCSSSLGLELGGGQRSASGGLGSDGTLSSEGYASVSSGASTRHNSLRLVVPGELEELLPAVPEEREAEAAAAAAAATGVRAHPAPCAAGFRAASPPRSHQLMP